MTKISQEQANTIPDRPEDLVTPCLGDGLESIIETRIGRMARHARFYRDDGDEHAEQAWHEGLHKALALDNPSFDDAQIHIVARALIKYAPSDSEV